MNYAQIAYEAYRAHTGGKSLATGQDIPTWEGLRVDIQEAWKAASAAVITNLTEEVGWRGDSAMARQLHESGQDKRLETLEGITKNLALRLGIAEAAIEDTKDVE